MKIHNTKQDIGSQLNSIYSLIHSYNPDAAARVNMEFQWCWVASSKNVVISHCLKSNKFTIDFCEPSVTITASFTPAQYDKIKHFLDQISRFLLP